MRLVSTLFVVVVIVVVVVVVVMVVVVGCGLWVVVWIYC